MAFLGNLVSSRRVGFERSLFHTGIERLSESGVDLLARAGPPALEGPAPW